MEENLEPPKPDTKHKAQLIMKGALSGIPGVGGAVGETFDIIYKSGFEKKLGRWRENITNKLISLDAKVSLSSLIEDEEFHSLLTEATLIALRNHQEIKLEAVGNLLINSTVSPLDYDFKKLFLNYIDQFTTYHLRTIGLIIENERQKNPKNRLVIDSLHNKILNEVFHGEEELKSQVFEELKTIKGLITRTRTNTEIYSVASFVTLTKLGERFAELVYP